METALRRTPLHALHLELGARMVPFAGYAMPVQYPTGILAEHRHTRSQCSLFDVSHMGQARLRGRDATAVLESLCPADVAGLAGGRQRYSLFTNEAGGILDDFMIANAGDHLFIVVNASRKECDFDLLRGCGLEVLEGHALLALQGPEAPKVLGGLAAGIERMEFMSMRRAKILGFECAISRSGYTGEDGYEISVPAPDAAVLARALLSNPAVKPAGLGARDSLRLEAGLCLYGHDIDATTTPVEAALEWAIPKVRRRGGARAGGFPGAPTILDQIEFGVLTRRVGVRPEGRAPLREGERLYDPAGSLAGRITSGGFGATLDAPVAMAYVQARFAAPGTGLSAIVRGRPQPCRVASLPFVPHRYYRGPQT